MHSLIKALGNEMLTTLVYEKIFLNVNNQPIYLNYFCCDECQVLFMPDQKFLISSLPYEIVN